MIRKCLWVLLLLLLVGFSSVYATDYYVKNGGDDEAAGTSDGAAWATITKVNATMGSFGAGDTICFKRGSTWTGITLLITASGADGNLLTFKDYDTGNKPIIDCNSSVDAGIRLNTDNQHHVKLENIRVTNSTGSGISIWHDNMSDITVSACDIDNCSANGLIIFRVDTYTIENCTVHTCSNAGLALMGSEFYKLTNGTVTDNTIYSATDGITLHRDGSNFTAGDNHTFENNTVYSCSEEGMDLGASSSNLTIGTNDLHSNTNSGLIIGTTTNVTIEKNKLHENGIGLTISSTTTCVVKTNLIYKNTGNDLIVVNDCSGLDVYNNTFVKNSGDNAGFIDIQTGGSPSDLEFKNNIFYHLQTGGWVSHCFIRYIGALTPANTNSDFDYNLYFIGCTDPQIDKFKVGVSSYNFSEWQSTFSQDANSLFFDPQVIDVANDDFILLMASPCIDKGTDVGLTEDYQGLKIRHAPDIGAYENQTNALFSPAARLFRRLYENYRNNN